MAVMLPDGFAGSNIRARPRGFLSADLVTGRGRARIDAELAARRGAFIKHRLLRRRTLPSPAARTFVEDIRGAIPPGMARTADFRQRFFPVLPPRPRLTSPPMKHRPGAGAAAPAMPSDPLISEAKAAAPGAGLRPAAPIACPTCVQQVDRSLEPVSALAPMAAISDTTPAERGIFAMKGIGLIVLLVGGFIGLKVLKVF